MLLNTNQGIRPNSAGHSIFVAKLSSKSKKGQVRLQMSDETVKIVDFIKSQSLSTCDFGAQGKIM